ncbi:MAG: hypothetical protein ACREQI_16635 [Candidatus Binataceae bacterium]
MKAVRTVLLAAAAAAACSGCLGAGIASMAPAVAGGVIETASIAASQKTGSDIGKAEQTDRCGQLAGAPPGVQELRKGGDGIISTRQWNIAWRKGAPIWTMTPEQGAPLDGWMPKPNISRLGFKPEIYGQVDYDSPRFLAYAPADVRQPSDSAKIETMTEAFGAGIGTFQWRGRSYSYVLVKKLPCFQHEP